MDRQGGTNLAFWARAKGFLDQNVSVNDALKWFQSKAKQFGLDRSGKATYQSMKETKAFSLDNMYGTVSEFMRRSGKNEDGNLTVVEFFVNLKSFREIYVDFKKN